MGRFWDGNSQYQELYDKLFDRLVPEIGPADTDHGEVLRCLSNLYYDYYNNALLNFPIMRDEQKVLDYIDTYTDDKELIETVQRLARELREIPDIETCPDIYALTDGERRRLEGLLEQAVERAVVWAARVGGLTVEAER